MWNIWARIEAVGPFVLGVTVCPVDLGGVMSARNIVESSTIPRIGGKTEGQDVTQNTPQIGLTLGIPSITLKT